MSCGDCDWGCPAKLEDGQPCGKAPAICIAHYHALEAALMLASDFVTRVCHSWEGAEMPSEREAKTLDGVIATSLRRLSPSGSDPNG